MPPDSGLSVLLAEHEPEVAELARRYLTRAGASVTIAAEAGQTTAALAARAATVAVLDLTMPGLDARRLRRLLAPRPPASPLLAMPPRPAAPLQPGKSHQSAQSLPARWPALFLLSAAMRPRDLRVAAESCLWRPFSPRLLVSRVLAIAPRPAPAPGPRPGTPAAAATPDPPLRTAGGLILDPATRHAQPAGQHPAGQNTTGQHPASQHPAGIPGTPGPAGIPLTPAEFALLTALAEHPGHVLTRDRLRAILTRATSGRPTSGRAVDVHVSQLRSKLPDPALIRTVRGVGYILDEPDHTAADGRDG